MRHSPPRISWNGICSSGNELASADAMVSFTAWHTATAAASLRAPLGPVFDSDHPAGPSGSASWIETP